MHVERVVIEKRVSKNTVRSAEKIVNKIARIERRSPVKAKALRHAGMIPKSTELAGAVRSRIRPSRGN